MIDVETRFTPGWWLKRLADKLDTQADHAQDLWDRYDGKNPGPALPKNAPSEVKGFYEKARLNMAELIVGTMLERIRLRSIATGGDEDQYRDRLAWDTMVRAGVKEELSETVRRMLVMGNGYMIVGDSGVGDEPDIHVTSEDPRNVVTIHDPVNQARVRAGAKFYLDEDYELMVAYLYLPGVVYRATTPATSWTRFTPDWEWDPDAGGVDGLAWNALSPDFIPVQRFRDQEGVGEFERHTDLLDRINHMILQRMVIATMQAFRQRAIKGSFPRTYPEGHPRAGQEIDYNGMFEADPAALWLLPETAEIWESGQVDLQGILSAVSDDVKNLAAVTRRPLPVLAPTSENQSAEGAALSREGLVFATEDRLERIGTNLAAVVAKVFDLLGDEQRADVSRIRVSWMPVDRYSLPAKAQAAQLAAASGMSMRWILENCWQASPDEVEAELQAQSEDMFRALLSKPETPVAGSVEG